jgi:large subunit ribosomal protein L21
MYAIIRDGSRSFRAEEGAILRLDLRAGAVKGEKITLDRVEFVGGEKPRVGDPVVKGARVIAEVCGEVRGEKLIAYKYKRRKGYERRKGHRQRFTDVKVLKVEA